MRFETGCLIAVLMFAASGSALAAEPIEGRWRTANGETAEIAACGGNFCITVATGQYAGKRIGRLSGSGGDYKGEITDPSNERTYAGTAQIASGRMELTGCALRVFCRTQVWTRR